MTLTFSEELEVKVISQASQVALEFLRASPPPDASETIKRYNKIFEEVYRKTSAVVSE